MSGTTTINWAGADDVAKRLAEGNKGVISKNCGTFTDCIGESGNTQIDNLRYM